MSESMKEKIALAIKENADHSDYVEDYFYAANAVLEALMEPTPEMMDAMRFASLDELEKTGRTTWTTIWQAAIKEVMGKGEDGWLTCGRK